MALRSFGEAMSGDGAIMDKNPKRNRSSVQVQSEGISTPILDAKTFEELTNEGLRIRNEVHKGLETQRSITESDLRLRLK